MRTTISFFILLLAGCGISASKQDIDFGKDSVITFQSGGGYCSICSSYNAVINGDGSGKVKIASYNNATQEETNREVPLALSPEQVESLFKAFRDADFLALKDDYSHYDTTDRGTVILSIRTATKEKKISHYGGDNSAPDGLKAVEALIWSLVESK